MDELERWLKARTPGPCVVQGCQGEWARTRLLFLDDGTFIGYDLCAEHDQLPQDERERWARAACGLDADKLPEDFGR